MQPDLESMKQRLEGHRDLVDRLTGKIPGYETYVQDKESYTADQVVRGLLADDLQKAKDLLNRKVSDLSRKGDKEHFQEMESLATLFEKLIKRTRNAEYSPSELSHMTVPEDLQMTLVEYDWRLSTETEAIIDTVRNLDKGEGTMAENLSALRDTLYAFEESLNKRKTLIMEAI
jgi:hypothetical protein